MREIKTGLKGPVQTEILLSVKGQMSDGIWENSSSMNRYWQNFDFTFDAAGNIIIRIMDSYNNPFYNKTDNEIRKYFANKIKQIVKIDIKDNSMSGFIWDRNCDAILNYMGLANVKVSDAYLAYDTMLGRKNLIAFA